MNIIKEFIKEDDGIGVVEIILILVVLVGLVIVFKDNISKIVGDAFENITDDTNDIYD
jgi:Flp pilus assembly pilin Flp